MRRQASGRMGKVKVKPASLADHGLATQKKKQQSPQNFKPAVSELWPSPNKLYDLYWLIYCWRLVYLTLAANNSPHTRSPQKLVEIPLVFGWASDSSATSVIISTARNRMASLGSRHRSARRSLKDSAATTVGRRSATSPARPWSPIPQLVSAWKRWSKRPCFKNDQDSCWPCWWKSRGGTFSKDIHINDSFIIFIPSPTRFPSFTQHIFSQPINLPALYGRLHDGTGSLQGGHAHSVIRIAQAFSEAIHQGSIGRSQCHGVDSLLMAWDAHRLKTMQEQHSIAFKVLRSAEGEGNGETKLWLKSKKLEILKLWSDRTRLDKCEWQWAKIWPMTAVVARLLSGLAFCKSACKFGNTRATKEGWMEYSS